MDSSVLVPVLVTAFVTLSSVGLTYVFQRRNEQSKWERDTRRQVYGAFTHAYFAYFDAVLAKTQAASPEKQMERLSEEADVNRSYADLVLLASPEVQRIAHDLYGHAGFLDRESRVTNREVGSEVGSPFGGEVRNRVYGLLVAFLNACRLDLGVSALAHVSMPPTRAIEALYSELYGRPTRKTADNP